jgi:hypothetical protein
MGSTNAFLERGVDATTCESRHQYLSVSKLITDVDS